MAINDVIITIRPCQMLSIPISKSSLLKIKTMGSIPVLRLYQKAWMPVLIGSALDIAAAA